MAFLEEYTWLDELGQGGYATVYKVRHNQLGYIRAIRVLNAVIARGEEDPTYQKFLEECRLLLRLGNGNHPNIVHIYRPLLKAQRAIVEMDYVDGVDLYHYLEQKSGFVEVEDIRKLFVDIGSALSYCHEDIYKFCMDKDEDSLQDDPNDGSKFLIDEQIQERLIKKYRVIHNDIHSGNIIRRGNGSYVLLDFGLAVEGERVFRSSRHRGGAPEFRAPEKWDNDSILSTQSDIYSFGVVMYEFLTGRVPFRLDKEHSNPIEAEYMLGKAHKEQAPESIYALRKVAYERAYPGKEYTQDYPQWMEKVIMRCLAKRPTDRFRDGKSLYDEIMRHIQEEKFDTGNSDVIAVQGKTSPFGWKLATFSLAFLLVLSGGLGMSSLLKKETDEKFLRERVRQQDSLINMLQKQVKEKNDIIEELSVKIDSVEQRNSTMTDWWKRILGGLKK